MTRDDRGSASVLAVALAGVLLLVGLALAAVAGMVAAHRQAQAAADLAALAGAGAHARGGDGCAEATALAVSNGARLESCRVAGDDVWVVVRVRSPAWRGSGHDLTAEARAGP